MVKLPAHIFIGARSWHVLRKCVFVSGSFDIEYLKGRLRDANSVDAFENAGEVASAVAIIIDSNRVNRSVLLIRRRDRQGDPWSGQIAFPGGHKSKDDQTLLQTAVREASEEVGIDLYQHGLLGVLPLAYTHTEHARVPLRVPAKAECADKIE